MGFKKNIVNILCSCIPSKSFSSTVRQALLATKFLNNGKNNIVVIVKKDGSRKELKRNLLNTNIRFLGDDNYIEIHEPMAENFNFSCKLNSQTTIIIGEKFNGGLNIYSDSPTHPNKAVFGKGIVVTRTLVIDFARGNGNVEIGDKCLFSWGDEIRTGDHHVIYKKGTKKVLNPNQNVKLGSHVWVGSNALILKGCNIADNVIIGANSVITKSFLEPNIVIAGSPARIVRKGVDWGYDVP